MRDKVILVNDSDIEIGIEDKMLAHKQGHLHRAFSVLIFNTKGELLLHKRTKDKYHSGGLWTNTCCSHPQPNEDTAESANNRLFEEMGITAELEFQYKFIYKAKLNSGLTEYELDYVYTGITDDIPSLNPIEAMDWKYMSMEDLSKDIALNPSKYTVWFKEIFKTITEEKILA